jgi:hypothetical protein
MHVVKDGGTHYKYETMSKLRSNFTENHIKDASSYTGPYKPKVDSSRHMDFEVWWNWAWIYFKLGNIASHPS